MERVLRVRSTVVAALVVAAAMAGLLGWPGPSVFAQPPDDPGLQPFPEFDPAAPLPGAPSQALEPLPEQPGSETPLPFDTQPSAEEQAPGAQPPGPLPEPEGDEVFYEPMLSDDYGAGGRTQICGFCGDPSCVIGSHWFVEVDMTVLQRNRPRRAPLSQIISFTPVTDSSGVQTDNVATFTEVLDTNTLRFDFEVGTRLLLGKFLGRDYDGRSHTLEFEFFGFNSWDELTTAQGSRIQYPPTPPTSFQTPFGVPLISGNLVTPFNGGSIAGNSMADFARGFDNADLHEIEASSEVFNFELNRRVRRGPGRDQLIYLPGRGWAPRQKSGLRPSALIGARVIKFRDDFDFFSRGLLVDPFEISDFSGAYMVQCENVLAGLQLGGDLMHIAPLWSAGFRGKAGIFANFSRQDTQIIVRDASIIKAPLQPPDDTFQSASDQSASFVGEFGFKASLRLSPYLSLRGAWDMIWITGLALAPEQLAANVPVVPTVNTTGYTVIQGLSAGVEFVW